MILRIASAVHGRRYVVAACVLSLLMTRALGPDEFPTWRAWAIALGGSVQILGPAAAAYAAIVVTKLRSGELGNINAAAAREPGDRRLVLFALLYVLSVTAYGLAALIMYIWLAVSQPWDFALSWWLVLPLVTLPSYLAAGLLVGDSLRRAWVAAPLAFILYAVQVLPMYLRGAAAHLGPVLQPFVDGWTVERPTAKYFILWWVSASLVLVTAAAVSSWRDKRIIATGLAAVLAVLTGTQVASAVERESYFARQADPALSCADVDTVEVCIHPAFHDASGTVAGVVRTTVPRLRAVGVTVTRFEQVSSMRRASKDLTVLPFDVYSSRPYAVEVGFQDGFRRLLALSCPQNNDHTALQWSLFVDWLTRGWPKYVDDSFPAATKAKIRQLSEASAQAQAAWMRNEMKSLGCKFAH